MGWFAIGEQLLGGDAPLDAYGGALDRIAKEFTRAIGRKPSLAEIVEAFGRAAPDGASPTHDGLQTTVALPAPPTSSRPPKLLTGDLVELPYDEGRAVVGLVLFGEEQKGGGYGPCVVPLDLEVEALDTFDRARTSRWLTRPFHPGSGRHWKRLGRVMLEPDVSFLPCFAWYRSPGRNGSSAAPFRGSERFLLDYFKREVPVDRAHESRVVRAAIGGRPTVAIRAARGMNRSLPWEDEPLDPDGEPTPLASLPPFKSARAPRPKKQPTPTAPDAVLLVALDRALAEAREHCDEAWREAVGRGPVREELAHALANVLVASPDRYTCDPTRTELVPLSRMRHERTGAAPRIELRVVHGRDQVIVDDADGSKWSAFPFFEDGQLVVETTGAAGRGVSALARVLALWRSERGLAADEVDVIVRPMDWGGPTHTRG
ncbi:MAG: hypothetical protein J0L92_18630 [Deltaproteobacteria bacterium]|nr:hypothetical protein [Deltaproteobacteria bacterium]